MAQFEFDINTGTWEQVASPPPTEPPSKEPETPIETTYKPVNTEFLMSGNYSGTEEDFLRKYKPDHDVNSNPGDRSWSVVDSATKELSLSVIITNIIEGYGKGKYEIQGLPPEWDNIVFTTEHPLEQDGSDWAFFVSICQRYGYKIVREDHGRVFRFFPEADGIDNTVNYRIALHSYGGKIYDLDFLYKKLDENPVYIIKDGLSITVSSDTGFVPQVKQFITDEGESKVVVPIPEELSAFLQENHVLDVKRFQEDYELNKLGKLSGEEKLLFDRIDKHRASFEDYLYYFDITKPDYNSNDTEDTGYKIHVYEGWSTSFSTHGNVFATPGEWLIIEGTSSNLYFPFQISGITHTFNHTWNTDYELIR